MFVPFKTCPLDNSTRISCSQYTYTLYKVSADQISPRIIHSKNVEGLKKGGGRVKRCQDILACMYVAAALQNLTC